MSHSWRRSEVSEALQGGYIEQYTFDLQRNSIVLRVDVIDAGTLSRYEVVFAKVSRFEFATDSRSDAGNRLQVTELWVDTAPEGSATEEWTITISIFDMSHLRIRCTSILVDGETVV